MNHFQLVMESAYTIKLESKKWGYMEKFAGKFVQGFATWMMKFQKIMQKQLKKTFVKQLIQRKKVRKNWKKIFATCVSIHSHREIKQLEIIVNKQETFEQQQKIPVNWKSRRSNCFFDQKLYLLLENLISIL